MKKIKLNQVFKGVFVALITVMVLSLVESCRKDNDDTSEDIKTQKVVFKAEGSSGVNISKAVYGIDGNPITVTGLSGTTWTSPELTAEGVVYNSNVVVNATGVDAASTLKVQIWVDGQLKKESVSSGLTLSASTSYTF
ncbi:MULTISPECIES: hypothetical protein [Chryseobacterium]|jgi:hypothetical protein|uniref:BACON domain-containing protein n=2 Tax=Chryseobacterium TaxID=59732 RepID=A0AAX2IJL7_9FLAO|nr:MULTISPECIES: hypothetical protein [Chryseobacterium]AZB30381.1 hypothetical protein EB354_14575 [Chryseobacterium balustinum]REC56578.1 hypothetical protein DRF62_03215 [Chryseobacterium piscium]SKB46721.1 hypothetical protein SAMN05421800_10251 [Chryseobacterium balustinum]SQA89217.1 Uncharacterised protein [Chryseobacterium balustinum]